MLINIYFEDFVDRICHRQEFEFPYKEGDQTTRQSRDKAWYVHAFKERCHLQQLNDQSAFDLRAMLLKSHVDSRMTCS